MNKFLAKAVVFWIYTALIMVSMAACRWSLQQIGWLP